MLPEAFLERMQRLLGEEYEDFLETFEQERYQALRLNALKRRVDGCNAVQWCIREGDAEASGQQSFARISSKESGGYKEEKAANFIRLIKVPWAENGYYYQNEDQPGKHPYHEAGLYYIQEPSAMAPVELLRIQPGERVLDLCAAPGGKTTQIAAKLRGSGLLICNEIHPARAKILSENVERMGICNACVLNETPERLAGLFPEYFDAILVDAPCSGEGMFRKNEAACEEWSKENVTLCAERQKGILDCAARMLRPGGRLVYSTCTFAPEENEGSISYFLREHKEFSLLPIEKAVLGLSGCDGEPGWIEDAVPSLENALRLWPQRIKGEGHFAALLGKAGDNPKRYGIYDNNVTKKDKVGIETREFVDFFRENLRLSTQLPQSEEADGKVRPDSKARSEDKARSDGRTKSDNRERPDGRVKSEDRARPDGRVKSEDRARPDGRTKFEDRARLGGRAKPITEPEGDESNLLVNIAGAVGVEGPVRLIRFGDNIYLVSADLPSLKGLKVLRPGLHLGECKKGRFEPSHALALALSPGNAVHIWNLDSHSPLINAYLNGQTFTAEGEKGWYLICVDGFGLGWGKLAGSVMKNHYPKGLRR